MAPWRDEEEQYGDRRTVEDDRPPFPVLSADDQVQVNRRTAIDGARDVTGFAMSLHPQLPEIRRCAEAVDDYLSARAISRDVIFQIDLALDELLTNTIEWGYGNKSGADNEIKVNIEVIDQFIFITVEDNASAFNPLDMTDPDIYASLQDRPIGGLGIYFIRQVMDEILYERKNNKNILSMRIKVDNTHKSDLSGV